MISTELHFTLWKNLHHLQKSYKLFHNEPETLEIVSENTYITRFPNPFLLCLRESTFASMLIRFTDKFLCGRYADMASRNIQSLF